MVGGLAGGAEGEVTGKKAQKKRGPGKPDPLTISVASRKRLTLPAGNVNHIVDVNNMVEPLSEPDYIAKACREIIVNQRISNVGAEPVTPLAKACLVGLRLNTGNQVSQVLQAILGHRQLGFRDIQEHRDLAQALLVQGRLGDRRLGQRVIVFGRRLREEQPRPQRRMNPRRYRWNGL